MYYDDNFGEYEIRDEEDIEFYHQMQRESVDKQCQGCGRTVRIRPDYAYCNSCATIIERGGDLPGIPEEKEQEEDTCFYCDRVVYEAGAQVCVMHMKFACCKCGKPDAEERYSLGIYAGKYCDGCWDKAGYRKEGAGAFDPLDAGERYEDDY
jgi:hypothetical protein